MRTYVRMDGRYDCDGRADAQGMLAARFSVQLVPHADLSRRDIHECPGFNGEQIRFQCEAYADGGGYLPWLWDVNRQPIGYRGRPDQRIVNGVGKAFGLDLLASINPQCSACVDKPALSRTAFGILP